MKETTFPILEISTIAEKESWRKEINRPIYHLHKWWGQRLGSVFRAILIHLMKPTTKTTWDLFYENNQFDKVVFDPFMGSGTTIGEAVKLGARAIGCDINPISSFLVKQELTYIPIVELERQMNELEAKVASKIRSCYITVDPSTKEEMPVLYYFWVKIVVTPSGEHIPLFSNYIFARNANPSKNPYAQILCPKCWGIIVDKYDSIAVKCPHCNNNFNPQIGPAKGAFVYDSVGKKYKIKSLIINSLKLHEKMYALLVLDKYGNKKYIRASKFDETLYQQIASKLDASELPIPQMLIEPGHNTDQARGYNYLAWRDFFNSRQLYCLGTLLKEILQIPTATIREQFLCLFSSTLEFNNMFCTYKGEGTGAVRPIFSNHILKPERTPLENSVWGLDKSSGCFSTLYKTRFIAAKKYLEMPFEIRVIGHQKQTCKITLNNRINPHIAPSWNELSNNHNSVLILCGDSANVPIPSKSVDFVVTDPPYFDYIHYSELSDFFYAWLSPILKRDYPEFTECSSRRANEVQDVSPETFSKMLCCVFRECHRVMKDNAKMCFSFHHSRPEGWTAIIEALINAGFFVEDVFPIHAESMASTPKSGAKEPISLDTIIVCSKQLNATNVAASATDRYIDLFHGLTGTLSRSDIFVILAAQTLLTCVNNRVSMPETIRKLESDLALSAEKNKYLPSFHVNRLPQELGLEWI